MPAVAEVQFKATGSQQVVTGFKSIGDSASTATTKVQQNSTALKSMGQGMKSSVSGIGAVTTAFATLSISIVSTWRAYRDLGDAQIAVDKANLRVKKTQEAIKKTTAEIAALQGKAAKGGLEDQRRKIDLTKLTVALTAAQKKYGKNSLQAADAALALKEAQAKGGAGSEKLAALQTKLGIQQEQLGVQTDVASEAQERFNDVQQDFYLSILPTAISSIAVLTTAFKGLGSAFRGGGGLITGLGPIGLILGGITLAIIAFKTNFLGLRDAVGGVIDWIKERFGLWKDTIEKVFNLIRSGNWNGAFALIKEAAVKFWEDLKKTVPFFGEVESLVNKIRAGNWKGAFLQIWKAATDAWETIKKNIPLFGGIETFIRQLAAGHWGDAWNTIAAGAKTAFESVFGEKGVLNFQRMKDTAIAEFNLMRDGIKPALAEIETGLAKLGSGDIVGGFSQIWTGLDKAIGIAITHINDWVKLNFGVDLNQVYTQALVIGNKILDGIKGGLTFVARTWIDPVLTQLLDPQVWIQGFIAMGGFFVRIGTALYTAIGTALGNAAKDPKGAATWWGTLGNAIWDGITTWFKANLPGATKAMEALAKSFLDGVEAAKIQIQNVGIAIWNQIIEGIRSFTGGAASPFGPALDALKKKPLEVAVQPIILAESKKTFVDTIQNIKPTPKLGVNVDDATLKTSLKSQLEKTFKRGGGGYIMPKIDVGIDPALAKTQTKSLTNAINNTHATIKVGIARVGASAGVTGGISLRQHGYQSTVHRPTTFIAGEGGRPEDVTVRPRGSVQRGGSAGGGGFNGTINVYVDGVLRPARYDMGARK